MPDGTEGPVEVGPTGVTAVDAALDRLAALDRTELAGHVALFDDVQQRLHDGLAELDEH